MSWMKTSYLEAPYSTFPTAVFGILLFLTNRPVHHLILMMLFCLKLKQLKGNQIWTNLSCCHLRLRCVKWEVCIQSQVGAAFKRLKSKHIQVDHSKTTSGIKKGHIIFNGILVSSLVTERLDVQKNWWSETAGKVAKVDQRLEKASDVILWGM